MAIPQSVEDVAQSSQSSKPRLEHMICGECLPAITMCGAPLTTISKIVPTGSDFELTPCVVCFAGETLTCTECGEEITCL